MAIVLFILIAGLWAAFLLPSFFDHRSQTPRSTTKDFARTKQLLASVSASQPDTDAYVRRHVQQRRTRILVGLGITAAATLFVATWTGSVAWLYATIAVDVAIAAYVTVLLTIKRQGAMPRATIVPIPQPAYAGQAGQVTGYPAASTSYQAQGYQVQANGGRGAAPEPAPFEESPTVRVIAG